MNPGIDCEISAGVATVTLCNPSKLNAVNAAMWRGLSAAMARVAADDGVRCVIVRGAGEKAFAAGGDIEEFVTVRATVDDAMHYHEDLVASALNALRDCAVPTVAAIRGACVGGGLEIAGCCDIRIAGESSRFGAPINRLGFSMYPGEMAGLLALVGPAVVLEILLEGRILSAHEALVQRVAGAGGYRAVLAPATSFGKNLAPRAAALLDAAAVSDVVAIDAPGRYLRPIYAGNVMVAVESDQALDVLTVRTTAFDQATAGGSAVVSTLEAGPDLALSRVVGRELSKSERPELAAAAIVVSGGRGLGSGENYHRVLEPLADTLGAALGAPSDLTGLDRGSVLVHHATAHAFSDSSA